MGVFERYLSLWVFLCIVVGILIGKFLPIIPDTLKQFEYANVSFPIAILIWLMIYPMMLKFDFTCVKNCFKHPKGLSLTLIINWLVKPFTMYMFAFLFFTIIFKNFIRNTMSNNYRICFRFRIPCTFN